MALTSIVESNNRIIRALVRRFIQPKVVIIACMALSFLAEPSGIVLSQKIYAAQVCQQCLYYNDCISLHLIFTEEVKRCNFHNSFPIIFVDKFGQS